MHTLAHTCAKGLESPSSDGDPCKHLASQPGGRDTNLLLSQCFTFPERSGCPPPDRNVCNGWLNGLLGSAATPPLLAASPGREGENEDKGGSGAACPPS